MNQNICNSFTPTPHQLKGINHGPYPLMILAGAGTGKTTTLLLRIINMVKNLDVNPKHILTITYTEKAAEELTRRLINNLGYQIRTSTICTFHSFCYRIIQDYGDFKNRSNLIEESEAIYLILNHLNDMGSFYSEEISMNPLKAVMMAMGFINRCRDELLSPDQLKINTLDDEILSKEHISQLKDIKNIYKYYQKIKSKFRLIDYGDMIDNAAHLLKEKPKILYRIQQNFKHIIIQWLWS